MKLPDYCSPEEFATWLSAQIATNGGKRPTEAEWEEIKKRLENAIEWVHPWYLKPRGGDDDGGGGEDLVPPHEKWPFFSPGQTTAH
jgi:hypothetical protein